MCKSVTCPNCRFLTYHKGTCENEACKFNPAGARVDVPVTLDAINLPPFTDIGVLQKGPGIPFTRIIVSSKNRLRVEELAVRLGYQGPLFKRELDELFYAEPTAEYGFEIVKHLADPYIDWAKREERNLHDAAGRLKARPGA